MRRYLHAVTSASSASLCRQARAPTHEPEPASLVARLGAASLDAAAGVWLVASCVRDAEGHPSLRSMLTVRGGIGVWCGGGWLYTVIFESSPLQATPGKVVANIRVAPVTGGRVGVFAAAVRNALRLIDLLPVLPASYVVGGIVALRSPRRQRVGDRAARCMVVRHRFRPAARLACLSVIALPLAALAVISARRAASAPDRSDLAG